MGYVKYVYWLKDVESAGIVKSLEELDHCVTEINKAVCFPLAENFEVGLTPPETWREYRPCRRQFSWLENSRFHGHYLLISAFDLS